MSVNPIYTKEKAFKLGRGLDGNFVMWLFIAGIVAALNKGGWFQIK
jgi:hypothetical protein